MFNNLNYQRIFLLLIVTLVVAGTLFGYVAHPAMYMLSIAIGVALVVVGMADATGMGLLLARLPSMAELPVVARRFATRGR